VPGRLLWRSLAVSVSIILAAGHLAGSGTSQPGCGKAWIRLLTGLIRLSVEDQCAFVEAMLHPPPLVLAIERYREIIAASVD